MRGTRKVTEEDILGSGTEEVDLQVGTKKEVKQIPSPYRYKAEFKKYNGNKQDLPPQKFNKKGDPESETPEEFLARCMFFSNFVNGKYKILLVYRGKNNVIKRKKFDIFSKKNKIKYNFFKQKGIIF
jgi:hypothetical protein